MAHRHVPEARKLPPMKPRTVLLPSLITATLMDEVIACRDAEVLARRAQAMLPLLLLTAVAVIGVALSGFATATGFYIMLQVAMALLASGAAVTAAVVQPIPPGFTELHTKEKDNEPN